ncbi:MAG TPA: MauE/DoxX family redox-associated membrane protein [Actinocrinis sp.]|nr:MauE/DoxX family redox-associated membrane protein [Actinocrinis sp.]
MAAVSSSRLLAGLLVTAGVTHFARPRFYDPMVPEVLPGSARTWTYASGVAEFAVAAALTAPRTRRAGALAAAGLFTAVFPANVKMAIDWRRRPKHLRAAAYARLPLQAPLVVWALRVARDAARADGRR